MACALWVASDAALPAAAEEAGEVNRTLLAAAKDSDRASVIAALDHGAAVDAMTRIGDTALLTACKKGDAEIARTMIDHGANVKHANASGVTPLMAAAYGGHDGIVALLLARGADPPGDGSRRQDRD
jgi:ankyrin repeat protein